MASNASNPAANPPRRPVRRIVPAIPLALTRRPPSTRPITPEGTTTAPLASPSTEAKGAGPNGASDHLQDGPPTPQSPAFGIGSSHAEKEEDTPAGTTAAPDSSPDLVPTSASSTVDLPPQETPPGPVGTSVGSEQLAAEPAAVMAQAPASTLNELETQVQLPEVDKGPSPPVSSLAPSHKTRPSMDHIVFGNIKQPQAPPRAHDGLEYTRAPAHPPGLGAPSFPPPLHPPPQNPPAPHLHQWSSPALSASLTNGYHGQVTGPNQSHIVGNGERREGYNGQMASYPASTVASGASRSESQSPLKHQPNDVKHGSLTQEFPDYTTRSPSIPRVPPNTRIRKSPPQPPPRQPGPSEYPRGAVELASYIFSQMQRPEFVDLTLKVRRGDIVLLDMPAHRIVVARSMKIGNAMLENVRRNQSPHVVDLVTDSMFVSTDSLNEAIKFLYGAPLLTPESFLAGLVSFHPETTHSGVSVDACHRMRNAISLAATGYFLDIYSVHGRGMEIAKALLRWDTLEVAIDYAWAACHQTDKHRLVAAAPENREEAFAAQLLEQDVVDFIAFNFPRGFRLDTTAKELRSASRLPILAERPSHNPRLSQIRFGDVPAEDDVKPDFVTQALSSILLSMPLRILASIFNHPAVINQLKWPVSDKNLFEKVITERERRRQDTLNRYRRDQSSLHLGTDAHRPSLVYNLLFKEYMTPSHQHPSGYTVSERQIDSL